MKKEQINLRAMTSEGYQECVVTMTSKQHTILIAMKGPAKTRELIRLFEKKTGNEVLREAIFFEGTISEVRRKEDERFVRLSRHLMQAFQTS